MRDVTQREYDKFWDDLIAEMVKARTSTVPMLDVAEMSEKMNVDAQTIYNYESKRRKPSLDKLFNWATVTGRKLVIKFE